MKLTYWLARCEDDAAAYSVRSKTRKECVAEAAAKTADGGRYGKPQKVVVEYRDAFDLLTQALAEGGVEPYKCEEGD